MRPRALTPVALRAPAGSDVGGAGDRLGVEPGGGVDPGAMVRWIAWAKAWASRGLPSLKRKPVRSLNVQVVRSAETVGRAAATSGTSW